MRGEYGKGRKAKWLLAAGGPLGRNKAGSKRSSKRKVVG